MLILADGLLQAPDHILRPGRLRISGRFIQETGTDLTPQPGEEILELPGITLAPGFLNLHAHLELTPLHQKIPAGLPFAEWLRQILQLLPGLHATARTASILGSSRTAVETGTTTILSILSDPNALAGLAGTLPRVWWALEFMDLHGNPQAARQMDRMAAWLSRHPGCAWQAAISPHAPYSASTDLYRECARLAEEFRLPFTTHLAESAEEEELFGTGQGSLRNLLPDSWTPGHLSDRRAAIPAASLLAHGNRLSEDAMSDLGRRGCFVIHCPMAHRWFDREPFPLEKFRRHAIPVILGTDSPASSDNLALDLRAEIRAFRQAHPQIPVQDLWDMVTTLPARALGHAGRLGVLQPGAFADWVGWKVPPSSDPASAILDSTMPAEIFCIAGRMDRPERL